MEYEYRVIRSKRKTVAIEIDENCNLILRVPKRFLQKSVEALLTKHKSWIETKMASQLEKQKNKVVLNSKQIANLKSKAQKIIPEKVSHYAEIMGLKPTGVKITSAQKRFGSCNGKNSLCFSYILMQYPESAIDYVVVHELAHIVHKNHSRDFYSLVESYLPDYKQRQMLLKTPLKEQL